MMLDSRMFQAQMILTGHTVKTLAKALGCSESTMYRRIQEKTFFTVGEITKIAELFGMSMQEALPIFFAPDVS